MDFNESIKLIAIANNTTPEEVYAEMQIALDAAYQNTDPDVQKEWSKIPMKGDRPTPEDVIPFLAMMLSASETADFPRNSSIITA